MMGSSTTGSTIDTSSCIGSSTIGSSTTGFSMIGSSMTGTSFVGSSVAGSSTISLKSTPSLRTTVSNCEKGLFTSSFMAVSGVKVILFLPSITKRSPVCTFTLSRSLVSMILNVPKPLIFTSFSVWRASLTISTSSLTNWTFFLRDNPFFWASRFTKSCFVLTILLPSVL